MNYLLVTSASELEYEKYCRVAHSPPPREAVKRQGRPGGHAFPPGTNTGYSV